MRVDIVMGEIINTIKNERDTDLKLLVYADDIAIWGDMLKKQKNKLVHRTEKVKIGDKS